MADQKISQLTDGGNAQAADEFVVARSGSNFRIDGASVAAAATSVGTLTSLTVSGDLTVDTSTLKVDSTNNRVGVGTASPTQALTVNGNAAVGGQQAFWFRDDDGFSSSSTRRAWAIAANLDAFGTLAFKVATAAAGNPLSGTTAMLLDSSGNLGLGVTPSGSYKMQVESTNQLSALFKDTARYCVVQLESSGTNQNAYLDFKPTGTGKAIFQVGSTDRMTLDASGNLGVGTASPIGSFDVATSATSQFARIRTTSNSASTNVGLRIQDGTTGTTDADGIYVGRASAINYLWTYENEPWLFGTNNTERARITSGGYFKASDAGTYDSATGSYHEMRNSANFAACIFENTNAAFTGNLVYINTTATAAGTGFDLIEATSSSVGQFRVRGDGTIFAQNTTVQSISDARLKDNVTDATDGLSVITALRPVRYDWKAGYGNDRKNQLGFIAQEMEAVFPEAVSEWEMEEPTGEVDEDGKPITEKVDYKTVGPGALIPVLVKAIQELEARIAVLEAGA